MKHAQLKQHNIQILIISNILKWLFVGKRGTQGTAFFKRSSKHSFTTKEIFEIFIHRSFINSDFRPTR